MPSAKPPTKISDDALRAAVPAARNLRQLLLALGVAPYGGNYEILRRRLQVLGIDEPRFRRGSRPAPVTPAAVAEAVASSDGWAMAARHLGLPVMTGQKRVKALAERYRLDTSHFVGQGWRRGGGHPGGRTPEPLESLLVTGRYLSTNTLKARLIREGVLLPCCAACSRAEWEGLPIPLELDHINGDRQDNRLENLRLLCPNCHAQTPTYRGRNIGTPTQAATRPEQAPEPDLRAAAERRLLLVLAEGGGLP